jgi:hypothetical protein
MTRHGDPPDTGPADRGRQDLPGHDGDGDDPGEDPVAVLQTALRVQQIGLNRLAEQVRALTTLLQQQATAGHDGGQPAAAPGDDTGGTAGRRAAPWCWRGITPDRATALWTELADWVAWLHTRYPLAEVLPGCWWRHPELVEELTAAHEAWKFANTSPGANPYGPAEWHDRYLPGLEHRLATRWKTRRCAQTHQPTQPYSYGTPLDDPDAFHQHTRPGSTRAPAARLELHEVSDAVASGDAEILGTDLGDPIYHRGRYWQIHPDGDAYMPVTDPGQLAALSEARRRIRLARATTDPGPWS